MSETRLRLLQASQYPVTWKNKLEQKLCFKTCNCTLQQLCYTRNWLHVAVKLIMLILIRNFKQNQLHCVYN